MKLLRRVCAYTLAILLFVSVCPAASAAPKEPDAIRVGYFSFPGYHDILWRLDVRIPGL